MTHIHSLKPNQKTATNLALTELKRDGYRVQAPMRERCPGEAIDEALGLIEGPSGKIELSYDEARAVVRHAYAAIGTINTILRQQQEDFDERIRIDAATSP